MGLGVVAMLGVGAIGAAADPNTEEAEPAATTATPPPVEVDEVINAEPTVATTEAPAPPPTTTPEWSTDFNDGIVSEAEFAMSQVVITNPDMLTIDHATAQAFADAVCPVAAGPTAQFQQALLVSMIGTGLNEYQVGQALGSWAFAACGDNIERQTAAMN